MPCWFIELFQINTSANDNVLVCAIAQLEWLRVLAALCSGALLGLAGCLTQWVFRNPLAEPYILGVTSGASLLGAIALLAGLPLWTVSLASLAGALSLLALVLWVARRLTAIQTLLWGMMLSTVCSSGVVTLMALSPDANLRGLVFWLMGDLGGVVETLDLLIPTVALTLCLAYVCRDGAALARLQLGDLLAQAAGVNVKTQRRNACAIAGIAVAAAFGLGGGVGFVGLIAPLLMHRLTSHYGWKMQHILWLSSLMGAVLVLLADQLALRLFSPQVLPVGAVLGIVGAGTMLTTLLRRNHDH
jgi:iron complex transport system permease protein